MNKYTFMGNGRNKDFYFTFTFFSKGDIVVKINGTAATGYGVFCIPGTNNNDFPFTGGHIHFATAPKSTDVITIERKLRLNRIIDYQPTSALTPTTINQDMNYFYELLKDAKCELNNFAQIYSDFTDTESAQILLNRINSVMNEIDELGDISTIRTNITNLGTSISNLSESLNTLSSTVSGHTTTIGSHTTSIGTLDTFKNDVLDYVIASQSPSSANNYTWYRKYKRGWVEQGGRIQLNGTISSTNKRVTFPITMADSHYFSLASQDANSPYTSFVGWQGTTAMSIGTNGASTTGTVTWMVIGQAAT